MHECFSKRQSTQISTIAFPVRLAPHERFVFGLRNFTRLRINRFRIELPSFEPKPSRVYRNEHRALSNAYFFLKYKRTTCMLQQKVKAFIIV